MRVLLGIARVLVAAAIVAAIVGQMITSLDYWASTGIANPTTQITNFFSFFTIDSNVLAVVALVIGAVLLLRRDAVDPRWYAALRVCVVTYMVTTGIVYNLLLRGIELPQGSTLPWSNEVLHVVAPSYLLLDWLFAPGRRRLRWRAVWVIIAFPVAWAVYTLIRGPLTFDEVLGRDYWYPYPFLDPNLAPWGYGTVAIYIVAISVLIGAIGIGAIWIARHRWPYGRSPAS